MSERLTTKSIRLSDREIKELGKICDSESMSESSLMRKWVQRGIYHYRLDKAVQLCRDSGMSLGQAVDATGVTYHDLMNELNRLNIPIMRSTEQLDHSVQTLVDVFDDQELAEIYAEAKRRVDARRMGEAS